MLVTNLNLVLTLLLVDKGYRMNDFIISSRLFTGSAVLVQPR